MICQATCVDCNRSTWETCGFSRKEDVVDKRLEELVEVELFAPYLKHFIANGYQIRDEETTVVLKDVEYVRRTCKATVCKKPFFDPPRKKS